MTPTATSTNPLWASRRKWGEVYPQGFNGYASAALYNLSQENILTTDVNNPSRQVQSGEARSRGIELELSGEVYKGVTLTSNYTYNNVETTQSGVAGENGKRLPGLPEHMFSTWVSYAFSGPLEGLTVGSGVRYIGSSYGDRLESASLKVPAYTLWDAMIAYDVTKTGACRLTRPIWRIITMSAPVISGVTTEKGVILPLM